MTTESDTPLTVWLAEQAETLRDEAGRIGFYTEANPLDLDHTRSLQGDADDYCSLAVLIDGMLAEHAKGRRALAATIPGSDQITEAYALAVTIRCLKMLARHVADVTGSVTP